MADTKKRYDVVIVGSGFAGATLAKKLGEGGKKVLILEAGPSVPRSREDYMEHFFLSTFKSPESPYPPNHLARDPSKTNAPRPSIPDLVFGWKREGNAFKQTDREGAESYLISKPDKNKQLTPFASTYERIAGGTGNHWMGTCLRMSENDFSLHKKYMNGKDWPITYTDLEKHYLAVEKLIGVAGDKYEQKVIQEVTDGNLMNFDFPMPGIPKSYLDTQIAGKLVWREVDTCIDHGWKIEGLEAFVTSTPAGRNSVPYQNRRVCHGNTNCTPICPIQAKYDPTVALNQAFETGNVDIKYQHVVDYVILAEDNGTVKDLHLVTYDSIGGKKSELEAAEQPGMTLAKIADIDDKTVFVLAANAIENAKIMLISFKEIEKKKKTFTRSASDSLIGMHLMDHPVYLAWGLLGDTERAYGYRGPISTSGIETGRDGSFRKDRAAWRIEIGNEGWNWPIDDPYTTAFDFIYGTNVSQLNDKKEVLHEGPFVKRLNDILTRQFRVAFLIEQDANENSYIQLSADKTDALGIPRVEVYYHISDYVKKGFKSARKAAQELFGHIGAGKLYDNQDTNDVLQFSHENVVYHYQGAGHVCGTHLMGEANHSVVDSYQRCHSHENLFLVGCGSMPSVGTQNPTLTMLAMTDRTGDHILGADTHPK